MKCNVGGWDRNIRYAVGTGALAAGLFAPISRGWRMAAFALATSELLTATTRYCPLNQMLGINTCERSVRLKRQLKRAMPEDTVPAAAI
jgi:hypothetical protein